MFTGIIQEIGYLKQTIFESSKKFLVISCCSLQEDLLVGESIACNGICLTVIKFSPVDIVVEIMDQTMNITTAKNWKYKTSIHLEKALTLSSRLNGHIVQGHVDTVLSLTHKFEKNETLYLEFNFQPEFLPLVVEHGSICIDGVSLTIAQLTRQSFQVALIKHTRHNTHFCFLQVNDLVNVEFDLIGKYIAQMMPQNKSLITEEWLKINGY